jgi:hypothetical protein
VEGFGAGDVLEGRWREAPTRKREYGPENVA